MFTIENKVGLAVAAALFTVFGAGNAAAQAPDSASSEAVAPPAPDPGPVPAALPPEPPSVAGWHDGLFYLRDRGDNFRLYVQGRVHADGVGFFGPAATALPADQALRTTLYLRR